MFSASLAFVKGIKGEPHKRSVIESIGVFIYTTVKPVYNDRLIGYFSAFSSSPRRQKLLIRVNWYFQSSLEHITE